MDKIEMKAPYSRKDIEDWIMKTSDGYLPQTYNLKALTNLIRKYNSDFVVPLQSSTVTNEQVISDEEKYKTALEKIIAVQNDDNYFLMPPLDMLFTITEIAKNALSKSKAIRDKLNERDKLISELQERAEIAEDELDKIKQYVIDKKQQ